MRGLCRVGIFALVSIATAVVRSCVRAAELHVHGCKWAIYVAAVAVSVALVVVDVVVDVDDAVVDAVVDAVAVVVADGGGVVVDAVDVVGVVVVADDALTTDAASWVLTLHQTHNHFERVTSHPTLAEVVVVVVVVVRNVFAG